METKTLTKLLNDFHNLTNIKACLYDTEGNELCFYPKKLSDFCEILRKDKEMDARCKNCDEMAFSICKKTHGQYAYTCHAGLLECVSPIIYDNKIIGFIMIGQIKNSDKNTLVEVEKNVLNSKNAKLISAYKNLPEIPAEKISSAFRILDACAGYELLKTLINEYKNPIDAQIEQYIHQNLSEPLSVSLICRKFRLSHSEIYSIFNEYFKSTPAEYIKKCRLFYSCKLLKTTTLPVNKIAVKTGIPDYNYFSKIFKSTFGVSPSKYRKSN